MSLGFADAAVTNAPGARVGLLFSADSVGCGISAGARAGKVAAVFERACNVALEDGQMIALLTSSAGNVAHGIRLSCNPRLRQMIQIGMPASLTHEKLVIGRVTVLLSDARVWSANVRPGMCKHQNALTAVLLARHLLQARLNTHDSKLLAIVLGLECDDSALSATIAGILPQLSRATLRLDHQAALESLSKLIGLGPGLTPAGDDFIIGWLAGILLMAVAPPELDFLKIVSSGMALVSNGTTPISRQHLQDAIKREFSERLSDVCFALASGAPQAGLSECLSRQLSVGATSGADAVAGLMFALVDCSSMFGNPDHRPLLGEGDAYP
jgi:hypothetical protein